jgi:hypothetical protein
MTLTVTTFSIIVRMFSIMTPIGMVFSIMTLLVMTF